MNHGSDLSLLRGMVQTILAFAVLGHTSGSQFEKAWEYAEARGSDALIVMESGKIVFEKGDVDDKNQLLASGTKSFCAAAMACAVQDGKMTGWDEKLAVAFPEWKDDVRGTITYRQLLSLSSGIGADSPGGSLRAATEKQVLELELTAKPGEKFQYGPMPFNVFSLALERKLGGEKIHDYLKRRVFDPLGIEVGWGRFLNEGRVQIAGMGRCSPHDWAKFGELMRLNGKHGEKQLWDGKTFEAATKQTGVNVGYGMTFWLTTRADPRTGRSILGSIPFYAAIGLGAQTNMVVPGKNAVIVRTGEKNGEAGEFQGNELLEILYSKE